MQEYRELNQGEQDALFGLYDKHNGNVSAMSDDSDCQFKNRNQVAYYRDRYSFSSKLSQIVAQRAEEFKKLWQGKLDDGKKKAIEKALELLENEETETITKEGEIKTRVRKPSYIEIRTAWEIIKTELGEPTSVSKNENSNTNDDVEEIGNKLNKLLENVKTEATKPTGENTTDEPPSV